MNLFLKELPVIKNTHDPFPKGLDRTRHKELGVTMLTHEPFLK